MFSASVHPNLPSNSPSNLPPDLWPKVTPSVSLLSYALAAIAQHLPPADATTPAELQFLHQHLAQVTRQREAGHSLEQYLQHPNVCDLRLLQLTTSLQLPPLEILTLALTLAVEEDVMVGRALAKVQDPLGGSRPTLGLLATALADLAPDNASPIYYLVNSISLQSGLMQILNATAPLPEQTLSVPLHLSLALWGQDCAIPKTTIGLGRFTPIALPDSVLTEAKHRATTLQSGQVLLIRTGSAQEGRSLAFEIAHALKQRPLFLETETLPGLGIWLQLRQLLPIFCLELGPGDRKHLPSIPFYHGPILVLCGLDGSVDTDGDTVLSWSLSVPTAIEREQLWQQAFGNHNTTPALANELATLHRHGSGRIAQLGELAQHHSRLQSEPDLTREMVAAAAWSGAGLGLDGLAQPLREPISDAALVVSPQLRQELQRLLQRCQARDRLVEGLGASATARYHPGVRALLFGASGTGKTLAVGWLATQLGLPLYRVDLSAITSKYIGETEKNLAQLLARAEQAEVVLLFDEADSLFGKRTDVKDSNDRFANAQTNYLLQRIETFDGITILTSNGRSRFDSAFSRRLDMMVEFVLPGPEERRDLWRSHLGTNHQLSDGQINQLAATCDLCGGHIRNAVLAAAAVAQATGQAIGFRDVGVGLEAEYRKLGQQMPLELKNNG
jgi:ATPase family associated with various cellular activities (AAA)